MKIIMKIIISQGIGKNNVDKHHKFATANSDKRKAHRG
jgi:hypothetical protein